MPAKLLIPREDYLASGIHIGMKQKTADMKEFIYKIRTDGLAVLNLGKLDERLKVAAKFIARCDQVLVASKKSVAESAVRKFAEVIGARPAIGRFIPGTMTNPSQRRYFEAQLIFIVDPLIDYQALQEAVKGRVPIMSVCDTFNETRNIDFVIPANSKGKKALATLLWVLAREVLKERGEIKEDKDFSYKIEDFEQD